MEALVGAGPGMEAVMARTVGCLLAEAAPQGNLTGLRRLFRQGGSPDHTVDWACPLNRRRARKPEWRLAPWTLDGDRSLLALAAAAGQAETVTYLLSRGAHLDMAALRHAVWALSAAGVQALLQAPDLPHSRPRGNYQKAALSCPILLLLTTHLDLATLAVARAATQLQPAGEPPYFLLPPGPALPGRHFRPNGGWRCGPQERQAVLQHAQPALAELEEEAVAIMSHLYAAGYRIQIRGDVCTACADGVWRMRYSEGLQAGDRAELELAGRNRLLWCIYCQRAWSPATHRSFHPAFKAAVRELLLVMHRQGAQLPHDLLHEIFRHAASQHEVWTQAAQSQQRPQQRARPRFQAGRHRLAAAARAGRQFSKLVVALSGVCLSAAWLLKRVCR